MPNGTLVDEVAAQQLSEVAADPAAAGPGTAIAQGVEAAPEQAGPSRLDQVANRITKASLSFLQGIPQIELDRMELENRLIDEEAQVAKQQRQTQATQAAEEAQLNGLFDIMNSPQSTQEEKDRAGNMAAAIDPELVQDFYEAIGVRDQSEEVRIADRAARVAAQPDRLSQDAELMRQITEGEAIGRDMRDSRRLLNMGDDERGVTLSLAQTAALSPQERIAVAQGAEGLALEARRTAATEAGVEVRREQVSATQALAEATRITDTTEKALKTEEGLRKEVNGLLKDYYLVADATARVRAAGDDPSGAGDLALIFNFMKILDPGSTVREGEFANAQNSGGVDDKVRGLYNSIVNGQRLSADQRTDFLGQANSLFDAQTAEAQKTATAFERIATNAGVNVNNVLAAFQERRGTAPVDISGYTVSPENQ